MFLNNQGWTGSVFFKPGLINCRLVRRNPKFIKCRRILPLTSRNFSRCKKIPETPHFPHFRHMVVVWRDGGVSRLFAVKEKSCPLEGIVEYEYKENYWNLAKIHYNLAKIHYNLVNMQYCVFVHCNLALLHCNLQYLRYGTNAGEKKLKSFGIFSRSFFVSEKLHLFDFLFFITVYGYLMNNFCQLQIIAENSLNSKPACAWWQCSPFWPPLRGSPARARPGRWRGTPGRSGQSAGTPAIGHTVHS